MRQRASESLRKRLGTVIEVVREHHGLSMSELASRCRVGRATVASAERGEVSLDTAIEILARVGVRVEIQCKVAGTSEPLDVIQAWDGGQR